MSRPSTYLDHEHPNPDGYHHYHYQVVDDEKQIDLYITVEVLTREKMEELLSDPEFIGITRVHNTERHTGALIYGPLVGSHPNADSPDAAMMEFVDHYERESNAF